MTTTTEAKLLTAADLLRLGGDGARVEVLKKQLGAPLALLLLELHAGERRLMHGGSLPHDRIRAPALVTCSAYP